MSGSIFLSIDLYLPRWAAPDSFVMGSCLLKVHAASTYINFKPVVFGECLSELLACSFFDFVG
jgi:hypothetical protein